ncbi:MAG: secondary thiamine-phosphate synthase enzyme YjbQ [Acidobacteria bacterium]|nr:secondary thiamine-phosphate synthase enzyme YjbQ [Acidobacteriota bacterium]
MFSTEIDVRTGSDREVVFVTDQVVEAVRASAVRDGICLVTTPHTSCAVTLNENADPAVPRDLMRAWMAMVPDVAFDHAEGNSDAHLLSSLIGTAVTLPIVEGELQLGRWQGVWLIELDGPRTRRIRVSCLG